MASKCVFHKMSANAGLFRRGHPVRVEATGHDAPYFPANGQTLTANVSGAKLALPFGP